MEWPDQRRQPLRDEMAKRRADLSPAQVEDYNQLITHKLLELEPIINGRSIMAFASIGNEVDLRIFMENQINQGKTILLPRVEKGGRLAAIEFKGWQHTQAGVFGIREPSGVPASPLEIDVVIVPGLVFDGHGYRLGYGKGYYDRFLAQIPKNAFICGVCYDFQVIDDIFPHDGDVPMHWIVTERSELVVNWDFF